MSGLYIKDDTLGPTLARAIGGIANNMRPKVQAEAEMLRQQTEAAQWQNWKLSTDVPAHERQLMSIPGLLATNNLPYLPPGASPACSAPGVSPSTPPGTPPAHGRNQPRLAGDVGQLSAAGRASPSGQGPGPLAYPRLGPAARGVVDTSRFDPRAAFLDGEAAAGRLSPAALDTFIASQQPPGGGMSDITREGIAKQQRLLRAVGERERLLVDPTQGDAPGYTIMGTSGWNATLTSESAPAAAKA